MVRYVMLACIVIELAAIGGLVVDKKRQERVVGLCKQFFTTPRLIRIETPEGVCVLATPPASGLTCHWKSGV